MSEVQLALPAPAGRARARLRSALANREAVVGWSLMAVIVLSSVCAPLLTGYDPLRGDSRAILPPGPDHPMGTDDLGRDVFSQVLYGLRASLFVGLLSSLIAVGVGAVAGGLSGYLGGAVDTVVMRVTELFQVVPRIFLVILTVALFGQSLAVTSIAIGLTSWPPTARLLRAEFLSRRESEYVLAARVVGASGTRIVLREILPNAASPLVVTLCLNVATAVLLEASLAFLGLSDPNVASLGRMLQGSIGFISVAWWMSVFPGIVVALIALAMNLVGDGVTAALDPRRRRR